MNPVIFTIFGIDIQWYSILILIGIVIGLILLEKEAKKFKYPKDLIFNICFWAIIMGIIGARLYYIIFNFSYYSNNLLEIFAIWNGGLAIHGGIIAGLLCVFIYCKKYNAKLLKLLDIVVVGLIIGQAIGRWGNFFNQEAYGAITTLENLQKLGIPDFIIDGMYIGGAYRQPAFLYESIWCLAGFIALLIVRHYRYLKTGQLTGVYLIWYSVGRFFIEGMRTDSLMLGSLKMAQVISIVGIIIGVMMLILCRKGSRFDNLYKEAEKKEITF